MYIRFLKIDVKVVKMVLYITCQLMNVLIKHHFAINIIFPTIHQSVLNAWKDTIIILINPNV